MPERPATNGDPSGGADASTPAGPPRIIVILVAVAIVLTVGAIVTGFVIAARIGGEAAAPATGPVAVPAVPAPGADGQHCEKLIADLPDALGESARRPLLVDEPGVAAYGDPAIILRCGLPDPAELTCSASLTKITNAQGDAVEWLRTAQGSAVTYLAVDRPVRVAVTVPDVAGIEPVQDLSDVIAQTLPTQPVCSGGQLTPIDNG